MRQKNTGFTLIELLVVIAIIGILAAIILPVYAQAKRGAFKNADMSNMNTLRTALGLYKTDQGGYPPALLGYVTQYAGGDNPTTTDVLPANMVLGALYPKRVVSLSTFEPAFDRGQANPPFNSQFTNPVWPNGPVGTAIGQQRYGPSTLVAHCDLSANNPNPTELVPSYYYRISGYDVATVSATGGGTRDEIHYSPFWTVSTVPSVCDPTDATGNATDDPHQLGYTDPPENTVVTWDSWFRDPNTGTPPHQKEDIVLYLAGDARPTDSANMSTMSWSVYQAP